ncbi:MAG TPA: hypothetical protein VF183_06240 [Acidimicrobiales bacterium]
MRDHDATDGPPRWVLRVRAALLAVALATVILGCVALVGVFVVALG